MQPLFCRVILLTMTWMLLGSSTPIKKAQPGSKCQATYYWYLADNDSILWYETTDEAINDLENMTGYLVNTQSIGGILLAKGYINNAYPHTTTPAVKLYRH